MDVCRVFALGISTELHSVGYVVFLQIEVLQHNIFEWINEAILFETIHSRKEVFHLLPESMTWFQVDGDPVQIEVYNDPAMLEKLLGQYIVIG